MMDRDEQARRCSVSSRYLTYYPFFTSSAQVVLNHSTHLTISGEELSQLVSYLTQNAPLNFWS